MYNYYPQTQYRPPVQVQQQAPTGLKGRPVSSIDEARAATIDFDGSIFFFPDLANKKIYTKHINVDGTMSLNMYELKEIPVAATTEEFNSNLFVTREEFENVINQLKSALAAPISAPEPVIPISEPAPRKEFDMKF